MTGLSYVLAAVYWAAGFALAIDELRRNERHAERLANAANALGARLLALHLKRLAREAAEGIAAWAVVTVTALVLCWLAVG